LRKGLNSANSKVFHKSASVRQKYFAQFMIHVEMFQWSVM